VLAGFGIAMIISSSLFTNLSPLEINLMRVAVVIGTSSILIFIEHANLLQQLLSNRRLVQAGLMSYSIYLFHFPIFEFARIKFEDNVSIMDFAGLIAVTFFIAYISWRYVEQPFRTSKAKKALNFRKFFYAGGVFLLTIGILGYINEGFPESRITQREIKAVEFNLPIYILGDSHASHLISGFTATTKSKVKNLTANGCIPLINVDRYDSRGRPGACLRKMDLFFRKIQENKMPAILIISSMGPVYLAETPFKDKDLARVDGSVMSLRGNNMQQDNWDIYRSGLHTTFSTLSKLAKTRVFFAIDVPELGIGSGCNPQKKEIRLLGKRIGDGISKPSVSSCASLRSEYNIRTSRYRALIHDVARKYPKIGIYDPTRVFCNPNRCLGYLRNEGYLYRDFDHLSDAGSIYYARKFLEMNNFS
jgi:hypothetical protein